MHYENLKSLFTKLHIFGGEINLFGKRIIMWNYNLVQLKDVGTQFPNKSVL